MFWIGYRFLIFIFLGIAKIKSKWDPKTKQFLQGRQIETNVELLAWLKANEFAIIQIHSASLGEFELSLPLYRKLRERYPDHKFLFSFFSPSGFKYAKIPSGEQKCYLPFDRKSDIDRFLKFTNPSLILFIKYEFWFMYLNEIIQRKIPFGFVNVNLQTISNNLKYKKAKELINTANFVLTTNTITSKLFRDNGLNTHAELTDLRYAQSIETKKINNYKIESHIKSFLSERPNIICGSIWKEDIEVILPSIKKHKEINWILAPHEVTANSINHLKSIFDIKNYFSSEKIDFDSNILVVDTIGDLKHLYRYGVLNYVGGAFKTGLHNVLEPLYAESLIVFGPQYEKFPEAKFLLAKKLAYSIKNNEEFSLIIENLKKGSILLETPQILKIIESDLQKMSEIIEKSYEPKS